MLETKMIPYHKIPYHSDTLKSANSYCLFIDFLSLQEMAERIIASKICALYNLS